METTIKNILLQFPLLDKSTKRTIYLRGKSGVGKTRFITRILEELNYDIIHYETSETKTNNTIDLITKNTISSNNVISSFKKERKRHVVLIDDTDSLGISDKTSLTTLIKLVRPKKTKKQQTEPCNTIPIIFVGNMNVDKNIKDLINVCHTFEMHPPTREQMTFIVKDIFPEITINPTDCNNLVDYIGEDLSKLCLTQEYYKDRPFKLLKDIDGLLVRKTHNADRSEKIHQLYRTDIPLKYHSQFINETDRTTVSLLWHENIVDVLKTFHMSPIVTPLQLNSITDNIEKVGGGGGGFCTTSAKRTKKTSSALSTTSKRKPSKSKALASATTPSETPTNLVSPNIESRSLISLQRTLPIYVKMLDNICYSDYIDRTTFQKQVWKLNEISSIIKTFKNNHLLHLELFSINQNIENLLPKEIRFTKILTKYSSEYNNFWFIRNICQTLGIDKNDLLEQAIKYPSNHVPLLDLFETNEFDATTLNRLIKYYKVCATGLILNNSSEVPCVDVVIPEMDIDGVDDN